MSEGIQRAALAALAERVGIVGSYHTIDGQHRVTSEETALLLLEAMGLACKDIYGERKPGKVAVGV